MNTTAEFLRSLANLIDAAALAPVPTISPVPLVPQPIIQTVTKIEPGGNEDNFTDHVATSDETDAMVPPLQQKIELLKKIAGVDSVYDGEACDCEGECVCGAKNAGTDAELETIKRNAGLAVATDSDFPEE